jgi:hypothetical protein
MKTEKNRINLFLQHFVTSNLFKVIFTYFVLKNKIEKFNF